VSVAAPEAPARPETAEASCGTDCEHVSAICRSCDALSQQHRRCLASLAAMLVRQGDNWSTVDVIGCLCDETMGVEELCSRLQTPMDVTGLPVVPGDPFGMLAGAAAGAAGAASQDPNAGLAEPPCIRRSRTETLQLTPLRAGILPPADNDVTPAR